MDDYSPGIPAMILLLGGTSETAPIANSLAEAGLPVLVSMATDVNLDCGRHSGITVRHGRLTEAQMVELIQNQRVRILIDATHPHAAIVHRNARAAARCAGCSYMRFSRPSALETTDDVLTVSSHEYAAEIACRYKRSILLTTGSKILTPYITAAKNAGIMLYVRVLSSEEAVQACYTAGLKEESIIAGRGPYIIEQNRDIIQKYHIGVLVTKDSGAAGGFREKIEAARIEKCIVIVVKRPDEKYGDTFSSYEDLIRSSLRIMKGQK